MVLPAPPYEEQGGAFLMLCLIDDVRNQIKEKLDTALGGEQKHSASCEVMQNMQIDFFFFKDKFHALLQKFETSESI